MLSLFADVIKNIRDEGGMWKSLEELMIARADFAVRHAFNGFGIEYDEALWILKNAENLTDEQRVQRDILIAAVDNLVDFSVAEEYQLIEEVNELEDLEEAESEEELEELEDRIYGLCKKYNNRYAFVENMDIEYAMIVAAYLSKLSDDTVLMYMTMGDERVRPWHLQYEGFTALKSQFPSWLIPPIEHQCRCFLVEDSATSVFSQVKAKSKGVPKMPDWFNPTIKESVAKGGKIFSDAHPYFQINADKMKKLVEISDRIKSKYSNVSDKH